MIDFQWYDWVRVLTVALSLVAIVVLFDRARVYWDNYTPKLKDLWWVMNTLLVFLIATTVGDILDNDEEGPLLFFGLVVSAISIRGLVRKERLVKVWPPPQDEPNI